jgi:uncharacterized protein
MEHNPRTLASVLIKPAGPDCNLGCEYCFYLKKSELFSDTLVHRMNEEVLKATVRQVMQQGGPSVNFGWQGGEPTLMGLDFFKRAVELQKRYGRTGQTVGNGLQTNGILIDRSWAEFLRDAEFLVGLSLDGPEHIHDRYRRTRNDRGTWAQVIAARDCMLDVGTQVNALVVVNDYSAQYPAEIYNYHKHNGLPFMQFIPCVESDPVHTGAVAPFSVSGEAFGEFLCQLFDLWISDFRYGQPTTSIRYFDSLFYHYVNLTPPECTLLKECGVYVVVEHNGDVYPCDFFVESPWLLGNVLTDSLTELLNSEKQNRFAAVKTRLPDECSSCEWLELCWGGCPKDRQNDPGDQGSNHFCTAYKMFFEHSDSKFRSLAHDWLHERGRASTLDIDTTHVGRNDPCPCNSGKKFKQCCGRY